MTDTNKPAVGISTGVLLHAKTSTGEYVPVAVDAEGNLTISTTETEFVFDADGNLTVHIFARGADAEPASLNLDATGNLKTTEQSPAYGQGEAFTFDADRTTANPSYSTAANMPVGHLNNGWTLFLETGAALTGEIQLSPDGLKWFKFADINFAGAGSSSTLITTPAKYARLKYTTDNATGVYAYGYGVPA